VEAVRHHPGPIETSRQFSREQDVSQLGFAVAAKANGDSEFLRLGWRSMVTGPSKMMTGPALRQGATTGQIEDFVGLSGAAFARCLMSLIARFRRLTELACRPRRRNAEAYLISAAARPAAQS